MKLLIARIGIGLVVLFGFIPSSLALDGRCVGGACADGYTGCGCDADCCRRRLQGSAGSRGYEDNTMMWMMPFFQQTLNMLETMNQNSNPPSPHLAAPETPEQAAARVQREEEARARRIEQERQRQEAKDKEALELIAWVGVGSSTTPNMPVPGQPDQRPRPVSPTVACQGTGVVTCVTLTCGGTNQNPVCCPREAPYLNHCDCQCYSTTENLDCKSYSSCQHSQGTP